MPESFVEGWLHETIEDATDVEAFPLRVPAGKVPPFVVFSQTGLEEAEAAMLSDGFGGQATVTGAFAVEIYADGYLEAKTLARQIRAAIRNFAGSAGDLTIVRSRIDGQQDSDPVFMDGKDEPTYVVEQTYSISWEE